MVIHHYTHIWVLYGRQFSFGKTCLIQFYVFGFLKSLRLNHRNIKFMKSKCLVTVLSEREDIEIKPGFIHLFSTINLELSTAVFFHSPSCTESWTTLILETWGKISILRGRLIASLLIFVLLWEINIQGALVVMFVWSLISRFNIWSSESNLNSKFLSSIKTFTSKLYKWTVFLNFECCLSVFVLALLTSQRMIF